ncbi:MAG: MBL fold metallo-hydrolase [Candidatus Aenigmatarchaeota archaeon]|nr:MAG: MBL fold metallo-hydrolase [Candidatus Aenigmarchaeota archaeon]
MVKITFLGTGGGRVVVINQLRATGGWILEMDDQMFHIDPGPGALARAREYGVPLRKVTGIIISHPHPDHYADAEMVVEAMTIGVNKKRGVIIGGKNVIKGGEKHRAVFSPYHLNAVERYEILEPGKETKTSNIKIRATPVKHGDSEGVGFVFEGERNRIGYTSDGEYFDGQEKYFTNCDVLVINCLRPRGDSWPEHMDSEQAKELIVKTRPKAAVLKHFGTKMLRGVAEKEAAWIEKETGIRTIAARDGMVLEIKNEKIEISKSGGKGGGSLEGFLK